MDAGWLAAQLDAGRSIESIARKTGQAASTVAYWVNKHGLTSQHAPRHRAKGPIDSDRLEVLVQDGRSIREIAAELDLSATAVRHWLRKYDLRTQPSRYSRGSTASSVMRECRRHGWTPFVRIGRDGRYRFGRCNGEAVAERRRRVKAMLVEEFGGACRICGFARYAGALQFHHVDPAAKRFQLGGRGLTRSLEQLREEARKCVLLCANCHAMVEAGVATLPQGLTWPQATLAGSSIGRG
jgi:DNA-binding transcriptional ArsR family regulator